MTLTNEFTLGAEIWRVRDSDRNPIKVRSVDGINELCKHLSAVQYPSRLDVAVAIARGEVLSGGGYTYALRITDVVGFEHGACRACNSLRDVQIVPRESKPYCAICRGMMPQTPVHYIAMSGLHGYLPDSCNAYETYQLAVDALEDSEEETADATEE